MAAKKKTKKKTGDDGKIQLGIRVSQEQYDRIEFLRDLESVRVGSKVSFNRLMLTLVNRSYDQARHGS